MIKKSFKPVVLAGIFHAIFGLSGQVPNIILGRPTDSSVTVSLYWNAACSYYLEHKPEFSGAIASSPKNTIGASAIVETDLYPLLPNTQYLYRVRFAATGKSTYDSTQWYRFHTARAPGSSFTFTIEADEHLYDKKGVKSIYQICLNNQAKDNPDFMLSLGDIFGDDHNWSTISNSEVELLHKDYRPFLGSVCHSIPFYVCLGNHEGENDYYYTKNNGENLCVWGTKWRKHYFPNPYPNKFYSGNNNVEPYGIGNPENYYAWNWGDALFVVLDVYRDQCDTSDKPIKWEWSLGKPQYDWLKSTLENSTAKYKFVFAHHIRGQGRGGITNATQFEWGGWDANKNSFAINRPGWAKPIHQLFVDNKVNIFFQGHDHVYAHELLEGVTYQAVPMPSDSTYEIGKLANASAYVSDTFGGTGHLRVNVTPVCVSVEFVRAYLPKDTLFSGHKNGEVAHAYQIGNCNLKSQLPEHLEFKVFPNPATNYIQILNSANVQNLVYKLFDAQGKLVKIFNTDVLNMEDLHPGIYSLHISHMHQVEVKRLLIIR